MSAPVVKTARAALCGVALLALGACNLAPKYVRPDLPVAPTLPQGASYPTLAEGATGVDAIGWQAFFTDPQLRGTIAWRYPATATCAAPWPPWPRPAPPTRSIALRCCPR